MDRREFVGTLAASPAVNRNLSDSENTVSRDSVAEAITNSQSYIIDRSHRNEEHAYWSSPLRHGDQEQPDHSLYYALLLEQLGINSEQKQQLVTHLLETRTSGGGWGHEAIDYGGLLLFRTIDDKGYEQVREDIRREIDDNGYTLGSASSDGDSSVASIMDSHMFRVQLLYALMSDRYSFSDLFPDGISFSADLLSATPALEGDSVEPDQTLIRPIFIGVLSAYWLLVDELSQTEGSTDIADDLEDVLLGRRLSTGAWSSATTNIFALFALSERGYDPAGDVIQTAVDWMDANRVTDRGRVEIWRLPIWDSTNVMEALQTSGVSTESRILMQAAQWLYDSRTAPPVAQEDTELDRPPVPFRPNYGNGWGYSGPAFSDWDDTALAIKVLTPFEGDYLDKDLQFLLDVQNSDGSWSAWLQNYHPLDSAEEERIRETLNDATYRLLFGRIRCPDITGGALDALGIHGYTDDDQPVYDAISYLKDARADNGMWIGVFGEGFTYGMARVMTGLKNVGVTDRPFVQRATEELLSHQNDDGGWGEQSNMDLSSEEPGNVMYRSAESVPGQTGWALRALLAAGINWEHPAIQRGISYLLETQRPDGSWPVNQIMYNFGGTPYSTVVTTQSAALKGLGMYAEAADISVENTWTDANTTSDLTAKLAKSGGLVLTAGVTLWFELARRASGSDPP